MATMPMTPAADLMAAEAMPAEETMPDGYVIEIMVHADGTFEVSRADMQAETAETVEPAGESYTDLGAALKAVMAIVKENPMGPSAQGQFDAGFKAKY